MIPVLMAIIALLDMTAPKPNQIPTASPFARWLIVDRPAQLSLAFQQPEAFIDWADQRGLKTQLRASSEYVWVTVEGQPDWLDQPWPGTAIAAAAIGEFPLWDWESLLPRLQPIPIDSIRNRPDFAMLALNARLAEQDNPIEQFQATRDTLSNELESALQPGQPALILLQRMASENLPPAWHLLMAEQIKSITVEEWQAWQTQ